jgi:hypothetical protein
MDQQVGQVRDAASVNALTTDIGVIRCFGLGDIGAAALGRGWAAPEDAHNWNDGPEAQLTLVVVRPDFRCVLVVEGAPLLDPAQPYQDICVFVNGWRLGFWRLTDAAPVQLELMVEPFHWRAAGPNGVLDLAFHLPNSLRLSSVRADGDVRELGFCFRTVAVFPAPHER